MTDHIRKSMRTHSKLLLTEIPPGQLIRFLAVGIWNTLFGYASFALCAFVLRGAYPRYGYVIAGAISSVLNISVAFLAYKWFVFKTKTNYLREWARCMVVYSSSIAVGLILLPVLVSVIHRVTPLLAAAPYVAAAILACCNALYNFLGNRKFTFKDRGMSPGT